MWPPRDHALGCFLLQKEGTPENPIGHRDTERSRVKSAR